MTSWNVKLNLPFLSSRLATCYILTLDMPFISPQKLFSFSRYFWMSWEGKELLRWNKRHIQKVGPETRDPGPIIWVRPGTLKVGPETWDQGPISKVRPRALILHGTRNPKPRTLKERPGTPMISEARDPKLTSLVERWKEKLWSK